MDDDARKHFVAGETMGWENAVALCVTIGQAMHDLNSREWKGTTYPTIEEAIVGAIKGLSRNGRGIV